MAAGKGPGVLAGLLLVLASSLVALFIAEWVIRFFLPQDIGSILNIYTPDEQLEYRFLPNARARQKAPEYDVVFMTSSKGFRDEEYSPVKLPGTCRIMVVGDSFAVGQGVLVDATFASVLERRLDERPPAGAPVRWEVINASVTGYHLYHYLRSIEIFGPAVDADLVLVGFFIGNDFGGHKAGERRIIRNGYLGHYVRPREDLGEIGLGKRLRRALTPVRETLATRSHLYILARNAAFPLLASAELAAGEYAFDLEPYRRQAPPAVERWYGETESLVAATASAARAADAGLLFVVIPDRLQVSDELWAQTLQAIGYQSNEVGFDVPDRRLAAILERQGVDYLDLLAPMRSRQPTEFYFRRDGHWNAAGHELAAAEIHAWIVGSLHDDALELTCLRRR